MRVEMADPAKVKLRGPLRLGGFLGFIGGFLLAYQRSSSKSPCVHANKSTLLNSFRQCSEVLGLVREQAGGGAGSTGAGRACEEGSAFVRHVA